MKELTAKEVEFVAGGVCEGMTADACLENVGGRLVQEVQGFFSGLNKMGSNLGSWFYNMTHC